MKLKKNKLNFEILSEAIIMIFLILSMPFVYSKLTVMGEEQIFNSDKTNDFLDNASKNLINFFDLIPTANAEDFYGCCKGTTSGACRLTVDQTSCNLMSDGVGIWASGKTCDETDFCKPVCCMQEGNCQQNVPKWICETNQGLMNNNAQCEIESCSKGCCEANGSTAYITGYQCDLFGGLFGYAEGSNDFEKEINCMNKSSQYPQGCCISDTGCTFTNSKACSGTLYPKFCSQIPECYVQRHVGSTCSEGDVYYTDSNNQKEELKENCASRNLQCQIQSDGSGKCVDLSCENLILPNGTTIKELKNMESICVFDQNVPNLFSNNYDESWGQTAVGSRHWVWRCINGKVQVEGCTDYRAEICAQIDIDESSSTFNYAKCIPSLADICYGLQTRNDCYNAEKTHGQCYWFGDDQRIKDDLNWLLQRTRDDEDSKDGGYAEPTILEQMAGFKISLNDEKEKTGSGACLPKYPKADSLTEYPKYLFGNSFVIVPQEKGEWADGWPCKDNCEVGGYDDDERNDGAREREQLWAELMSRKCSSVGDSGIKTNLVGDVYIGVSEKSQCFENDEDTGDCDGDRESETEIIFLPKEIETPAGIITIGSQWLQEIFDYQKSLKSSGKIYSLENNNFDSQKNKFLGFAGAFLLPFQADLAVKLIFKIGYGSHTFLTPTLALALAGAIISGAIAFVVGKLLGLSTSEAARTAGYAAAGYAVAYLITSYAWAAGPVGWIAAGVALIAALVGSIFESDARMFSYNFQCLPYSPPAGSANCELCNADPLRPCSAYRCWSLGADCVFDSTYGAGSDNEIVDGEGQCMAGNSSDLFPPIIKSINPTLPFTLGESQYTPTGNFMGYANINGILSEFDYLTLNLTTNEKTICRWSKYPVGFSTMAAGDGLDNLFPNKYQINHVKTFPGTLITRGEENLTLYIACVDTNGNENLMPFKIFVGVSNVDVVPPRIIDVNPRNDANRYSDTGKVDVKIFLNERVNGCKWSQIDQDYSSMTNEFNSCNTFVDGKLSCNTTVNFNPNTQDNIYYFRCQDIIGNTNGYSYVYTLHPSGPLNITEKSPSGDLESCSSTWNITLELKTDGGSQNGISTCYYDNGTGILEQFDYTNSNEHTQKLTLEIPGTSKQFNYNVLCLDESGNAIQDIISFNIIKNTNPPQIVRIYGNYGDLVIQTSKPAVCYYNKNDGDLCGFAFNSDILKVGTFGTDNNLIHKTGWRTFPYYVKCKDLCGTGATLQSTCTTIYPQDFT